MSAEAELFVRELGDFEHLLFVRDQTQCARFVMGFEVDCVIDAQDLHKAWQAVQLRHPLLSCSIRSGTGGKMGFYHQSGAAIPVRVAQGRGAASWSIEAEKELDASFDTTRAPLIRTVLVQEERSTLLIIAPHHSLVDGRGLLLIVHDLLAALAGQQLEPAATTLSREALIEEHFGEIDTQISTPTPAKDRVHRFVGTAGKLHVVERCLTEELTTAVQVRAHRENTSVNGAICAALALAGRERFASWREPVRMVCPIDLRQGLAALDASQPIVTWSRVICDPRGVPDIWTLARAVREQTTRAATADIVRAEAAVLRQMMSSDTATQIATASTTQGFPFEAIVTNLGVTPFSRRFSDFSVRAVYGPAVMMGYEGVQSVGIATTRGCLSLTLASLDQSSSLLEGIEQELRRATDS